MNRRHRWRRKRAESGRNKRKTDSKERSQHRGNPIPISSPTGPEVGPVEENYRDGAYLCSGNKWSGTSGHGPGPVYNTLVDAMSTRIKNW